MSLFSRIQTKYSKVDNNFGFSLMGALITVGIISMSFLAMLSMMSTQNREGKAIKHQLASMSMKYFMLQTLATSGKCTCQLNRFSIEEGVTSELDMGAFRSVCDLTTPDNPDDDNPADIIVKANELLRGTSGVEVESVKVSDIRATTTPSTGEYVGNLKVNYKLTSSLVRPLRPISIPLIFHVDMSDTNPAKPIKECWGDEDYSCYTVDIEASTGRVLVGCGGTSDISGQRTTAFGFEAGSGSTGTDNVFIGYQSGRTIASTESHKFALGNKDTPEWLTGDINTGGRLYLNGNLVGLHEEIKTYIDIKIDEINTELIEINTNFQTLEQSFESHIHPIGSHTHSMGSHSHSMGGHSHGAGGGAAGGGSTGTSGGTTSSWGGDTGRSGQTIDLTNIDPILTGGDDSTINSNDNDDPEEPSCSPTLQEGLAEAAALGFTRDCSKEMSDDGRNTDPNFDCSIDRAAQRTQIYYFFVVGQACIQTSTTRYKTEHGDPRYGCYDCPSNQGGR